MIRDLAQEPGSVAAQADVGVIGAGIAGLVLASRLAGRGLRVVVLESGDSGDDAAGQDLNDVEFAGAPYAGATAGRERGLGGTSKKWGGALLPYLPEDLEARPNLGLPAWPVSFREVAPYVTDVERLFGVEPGPFEGIDFAAPPESDEFIARYAKWPKFSRRNVATILKDTIDASDGPQVWLNATVTAFERDPDNGRLTTVRASAPDGTAVTLTASRFVLCAGAIESTRLLLWLFETANGRRTPASPALGRWFHDHLSAPLAEIQTTRPTPLNRLAAFRFHGTTMRNLRYELSPAAQRAHGLTCGFCHISCTPLQASGFDDLRDFMLSLQRRRPNILALARAGRDTRFLTRVAWWRAVHRQLCWPDPARYDLHVVVEQLPQARNRISLSTTRDRYGVPRATLDWQISEQDVAMLRGFAERFAIFWKESGLHDLGEPRWAPPIEAIGADSVTGFSDIYHPSGSTRMGRDPASSVVDRDLVVWGVPNLSVAATSVFPTIAGANPTMMLLLFTLRHADDLLRRCGTA